MSKVIFHYFITAVSVVGNIACAWVVHSLIRKRFRKLIVDRNLVALLIISAGFLLLAGIGKLGWSIQTYGGETSLEKLNNCLFLILSHIGTFLLFLHIFLSIKK